MRAPQAPDLLPARLSASAAQDLVDCPYRFFALRMLGLRAADRPEERAQKRDLGSLLHAALLAYHRGAAAGADGEARLGRIVDETFAAPLRQRPTLLGYRARVRAMVPGYLAWQARTEAQGWRWQAGELAAERPLAAEAAPGLAPLVLHGRIDRVDAQASGARRVLDYKTRDPGALRQELREPGEQVQLLVYHLLLEPAPEEAAYVSLQRPKDPRAPLDGVATLVAAPGALAESAAALESALAVALGSIARGAPLPASGAESVCRRCELRSLCRYGFTAPPAAGAPA